MLNTVDGPYHEGFAPRGADTYEERGRWGELEMTLPGLEVDEAPVLAVLSHVAEELGAAVAK